MRRSGLRFSNCSFTTCDISGYCGDITDYPGTAELYTRWVQLGAFTPLSRIHHEGNVAVEPWLFGPEAERDATAAIRLKYSLLPYIYTYARQAHDTGLPIMRPLFLEYPQDAETFRTDAQFMFGAELLVAPVVKKGARTKNVYLPEGTWIDYNDKRTEYAGEQWTTVDAPLSVVPLFVRRGSIIPRMPVPDYTDQHPACPLTFEVFPAAAGGGALYDCFCSAALSVIVAGAFICFFYTAACMAADFNLLLPLSTLLKPLLGECSAAFCRGLVEATGGCAALAACEESGFAGVVLNNLAQFRFATSLPRYGGLGLNVTNPLAADEYRRLGLAGLLAHPETPLAAMRLIASGVPTAALCYGHIPLMLTRACPLKNVRDCANCPRSGALRDRKGRDFPVRCSAPGGAGVRTVYNPVPLYMGDRLRELPADTAVAAFTLETPERICQILALLLEGRAFDGEFTRGLYYT